MAIKKISLLLVMLTSTSLFGITEKFLKGAVGASAALTAGFSGAKVWQGYSEDGVKLNDNDKRAIAALLVLPLATCGVFRGKTPAGRLRNVTSELKRMSGHRFVTKLPAEHVNRHTTLPRLFSLEAEGLKHMADLQRMSVQLENARADAAVDENSELCNQIEAAQDNVKEYQENVTTNLGATREQINDLH